MVIGKMRQPGVAAIAAAVDRSWRPPPAGPAPRDWAGFMMALLSLAVSRCCGARPRRLTPRASTNRAPAR
jgi:hypothetical protein